MNSVKRENLSNFRMVLGNADIVTRVIDGDDLKVWVGIGWITLRPATERDRKRYPIVED